MTRRLDSVMPGVTRAVAVFLLWTQGGQGGRLVVPSHGWPGGQVDRAGEMVVGAGERLEVLCSGGGLGWEGEKDR